MDMHQSFSNGIHAYFPNAHLTFDRFHVMKMVNEAVEQVRRTGAKEHPELKRTRYCWLKNPSNAVLGLLDFDPVAALANAGGSKLHVYSPSWRNWG